MRKWMLSVGFIALSSVTAWGQQVSSPSDLMSLLASSTVACVNQATVGQSNVPPVRFQLMANQRGVQIDNQNIYVVTNLVGVVVQSTSPLVVANTFRGTSLNALADGYQVGDRVKTLQYYASPAAGTPNILNLNEQQVASLDAQGNAAYTTIFNYQCTF